MSAVSNEQRGSGHDPFNVERFTETLRQLFSERWLQFLATIHLNVPQLFNEPIHVDVGNDPAVLLSRTKCFIDELKKLIEIAKSIERELAERQADELRLPNGLSVFTQFIVVRQNMENILRTLETHRSRRALQSKDINDALSIIIRSWKLIVDVVIQTRLFQERKNISLRSFESILSRRLKDCYAMRPTEEESSSDYALRLTNIIARRVLGGAALGYAADRIIGIAANRSTHIGTVVGTTAGAVSAAGKLEEDNQRKQTALRFSKALGANQQQVNAVIHELSRQLCFFLSYRLPWLSADAHDVLIKVFITNLLFKAGQQEIVPGNTSTTERVKHLFRLAIPSVEDLERQDLLKYVFTFNEEAIATGQWNAKSFFCGSPFETSDRQMYRRNVAGTGRKKGDALHKFPALRMDDPDLLEELGVTLAGLEHAVDIQRMRKAYVTVFSDFVQLAELAMIQLGFDPSLITSLVSVPETSQVPTVTRVVPVRAIRERQPTHHQLLEEKAMPAVAEDILVEENEPVTAKGKALKQAFLVLLTTGETQHDWKTNKGRTRADQKSCLLPWDEGSEEKDFYEKEKESYCSRINWDAEDIVEELRRVKELIHLEWANIDSPQRKILLIRQFREAAQESRKGKHDYLIYLVTEACRHRNYLWGLLNSFVKRNVNFKEHGGYFLATVGTGWGLGALVGGGSYIPIGILCAIAAKFFMVDKPFYDRELSDKEFLVFQRSMNTFLGSVFDQLITSETNAFIEALRKQVAAAKSAVPMPRPTPQRVAPALTPQAPATAAPRAAQFAPPVPPRPRQLPPELAANVAAARVAVGQ